MSKGQQDKHACQLAARYQLNAAVKRGWPLTWCASTLLLKSRAAGSNSQSAQCARCTEDRTTQQLSGAMLVLKQLGSSTAVPGLIGRFGQQQEHSNMVQLKSAGQSTSGTADQRLAEHTTSTSPTRYTAWAPYCSLAEVRTP